MTHVFVYVDGYTPDQRLVMDSTPALARLATADRVVLYRVAVDPASK